MYYTYAQKTLPSLILSFLLFSGHSYAIEKNKKENLPIEDLQRFSAVIESIRHYYVNPIEDKQLFESAIHGMLSGLDPHSAFLDPEDFQDLKVSTSGKFGGLGIEVTMEDGFIRVISPIDDTPAKKAGILPGDMIIRLDDTPIKGLSLKKAVELMRGVPGSKIMLTILRKQESKPLKISVARDIIRVKSVKTKILDNYYGYVRLSQFQSSTGEDLLSSLKKLREEAKESNLKGLILDLRNNPGGILESSVKVADAFLDRKKLKYDGLIVYTQGRLPKSELKERAHDGDLLNGAPIVVLINGGSASASEIVAGALQDHGRAVVMGTRSFGKGSVQTVLPLKDNYGLKLTTALYYTPSGRSIQAKGISPDIVVEDLKMPSKKEDDLYQLMGLKEKDLKGHLDVPKLGGTPEKVTPTEEPAPVDILLPNEPNKENLKENNKDSSSETKLLKKEESTDDDYQINEALNLLKALAIVKPIQ
jgi:carboxyl-terminal processing protease